MLEVTVWWPDFSLTPPLPTDSPNYPPFSSITTQHYQFLESSGGWGPVFFELSFPGILFHGPRRLLSFSLCRIPHSLSFFF